jgi:hypothetical protein
MGFRRRKRAQRRPHGSCVDEPADHRAQPRMRDLAREELEEPVQLGSISPQSRGQLGRIRLGGLDRPYVELQPVAEPLDSPEHADGVALAEAPVEELDVRPDARYGAPARVRRRSFRATA